MKNLVRWLLPWLVAACMHNPTAVYAQGMPIGSAVVYVARITPPPLYRYWYESMERCSGLTGNFDAVQWLITPAPWVDGQHGKDSTYGASWEHHILLNIPEAYDSVLVSHESLHDILQYHDIHNPAPHPFPWFGPVGCAKEFHERAKAAP